MTQANTNDNNALKKFAKIVLCFAAVVGLLGGVFNAITVYQVSGQFGGAGLGLVFQAFFAFIFSFFVYAFITTIGSIVLTVIAALLYSLFSSKKSGPGTGPGTGTPQQ